MSADKFDVVVIGSGPAGQKAAIQAAKAGKRALVVEQEPSIGGMCVHRGTIPSKTLRETAVALEHFRRRSGHVFEVAQREDLRMESLLVRLAEVTRGHERFIDEQLERNGVEVRRGRARFVGPHELEIRRLGGGVERVRGDLVVIATGSKPRNPPELSIDHENVLDSDSILSMTYLPASLAVLGAGVIASEYASIFAALGVQVTMVDAGARPLAFLDPEMTDGFLAAFVAGGGTFIPGRRPKAIEVGVGEVVTRLDDGHELVTEKVLVALGREANLTGLAVEAAGLKVDGRGRLEVDGNCRTAVPHIYAVGDVVGAPALAATSMEQGRRAVRHALGLPVGNAGELVPIGVYTIPEIASVGLSEKQAVERYGGAVVGRARFKELARGQIAAIQDGLIKMIADPAGRRLVGCHIFGEGAAEIIHVAQMALIGGFEVEAFVDNVMNFPTLAEGYRVAALDIVNRRPR